MGKEYVNNGNGRKSYATAVAFNQNGAALDLFTLWMVNSGDEAKMDAAFEFIQFMINPENQATWNAKTGYFPINMKAHDIQTFKDNIAKYPQFQTVFDQLHASGHELCRQPAERFPVSPPVC